MSHERTRGWANLDRRELIALLQVLDEARVVLEVSEAGLFPGLEEAMARIMRIYDTGSIVIADERAISRFAHELLRRSSQRFEDELLS